MRLKLRLRVALRTATLVTLLGHGGLWDDTKRVSVSFVKHGRLDLGVRKGVAAVWTSDYPSRHTVTRLRLDVCERQKTPQGGDQKKCMTGTK